MQWGSAVAKAKPVRPVKMYGLRWDDEACIFAAFTKEHDALAKRYEFLVPERVEVVPGTFTPLPRRKP